MAGNFHIANARIVNEGRRFTGDVLIQDGKIARILSPGEKPDPAQYRGVTKIDARGKHLMPGVIDDQVHFREPGLTHKGEIFTESRAAVAGGVTSFMDMPNSLPQTLDQKLLGEKYRLGAERSIANFSFYMGASNDNLEEILKTDPRTVCGLKVFMGASTGNMLVDDPQTLREIFARTPLPVAVHCEDEATIRANSAAFREKYGDAVPISAHPLIRSEEACYRSTSLAISLAREFNTRLHVLHLSTAAEMQLFDHNLPLAKKRITAEVCVHHLWFTDADYERLGTRIKWNPAIKQQNDLEALWAALLDGRIDIVATDHAPHTLAEKAGSYFQAPSGGPLVQHSLPVMLEASLRGRLSLEKVAEKMSHAPAECFRIDKRGFIREGYWADLVLVDMDSPWTVSKDNIHYKCGWSPFEGETFRPKITHTFVNGELAYEAEPSILGSQFNENLRGMRLTFNR